MLDRVEISKWFCAVRIEQICRSWKMRKYYQISGTTDWWKVHESHQNKELGVEWHLFAIFTLARLMLENLTAGFGEVPDATRGYGVQDTSYLDETLSFAGCFANSKLCLWFELFSSHFRALGMQILISDVQQVSGRKLFFSFLFCFLGQSSCKRCQPQYCSVLKKILGSKCVRSTRKCGTRCQRTGSAQRLASSWNGWHPVSDLQGGFKMFQHHWTLLQEQTWPSIQRFSIIGPAGQGFETCLPVPKK